jgi:hypothetical protein
MAMMINWLLGLAVLLGAFTIILLSIVDFHTPHRISDIRYAVLRERYYFALTVYATVAVFFYLVILNFLWLIVIYVTPDPAVTRQIVLKYSGKAMFAPGLAVALPATILIIALATVVPLLRSGVSAMRRLMWTLARYPQSVETVTALIARSLFTVSPQGQWEVVRELERYGVPSKSIDAALAKDNKLLAAAAARMLQEVCSLHVSFAELQRDRRFHKFFLTREDLETQYRRFLRRSARALLLTENIRVSDSASDDLALEISDFIAEECESLRAKYQRQIAEISLSCLLGPAARTKLISDFGYQIYLPKKVPFVPLVIVFVLDFAISVTPVIFANLPVGVNLSAYSSAVLALAHACALTVSVFFAIYPKTATNFARPSLFSLPWRSYILFGLISYLFGNALMYLALRMIDVPPAWVAATHPLAASSLFSLIFMVNTFALSILLDLRLRDTSCDYQRARFRDGVIHALVIGTATISLQLGIVALAIILDIPFPHSPWETRVTFTGLFAALGFAMGYLVPSTAQAHIDAIKIILASADKEDNSVGLANHDVDVQSLGG